MVFVLWVCFCGQVAVSDANLPFKVMGRRAACTAISSLGEELRWLVCA
jgi:hypothetical protein